MKSKLIKIISLSLVLLLFGITMPVASATDGFTGLINSYLIGGNDGVPTGDTGGTPPVYSVPPSSTPTGFVNPLTGMPMGEALLGRRPFAISIGNTTDALPMNGISKAEILYEVPVEGGLTRMLALFQDITGAGVIGSIRSARPYTVQIAESYDAIFMSAGGSWQAYNEIRDIGITHLDEVGGDYREVFFRDRNRISGRVVENYHSAVTSGALVTQWVQGTSYRTMHSMAYRNALSFVDTGTPAGGQSAVNVGVKFSNSKTSVFNFDQERGTYQMRQFNSSFIDANDLSQPAFTNLLILKTSIERNPGCVAGTLAVVTTGRGSGYFVCGGRYIEINWSRFDKSSPFVYTRNDGSVLSLGRGKTYIGIIPNDMDVTFN
jgi:hypothetical protein